MVNQEKTRELILKKLNLPNKFDVDFKEKKPLIEIKNLSINFKRSGKLFEAIKNVNLNINEGEILGIVGESGSGKTTLGKSILGLWDHSTGYVKIDEKIVPQNRVKSVSEKNKWIYEKGQMIFQDPTSSLNRQEKVYKIITEGLLNFKTIEKDCESKIIEIDKEILTLKNKIKLSQDSDELNKVNREKLFDKEYVKLIKENQLPDFVKYLDDLNTYNELNDELKSLEVEQKSMISETKKFLKINKLKTKTNKLNLKNSLNLDTNFFKEFKKTQASELKILIDRNEKDSISLSKRVEKRNAKFINYLFSKLNNFENEKIKDEILRVIKKSLIKQESKIQIDWLEEYLKKNKNIFSEKDLNVIKNFRLGLMVLQKKFEKDVSDYNTWEFDRVYEYIDDVLATKINYYLVLISDIIKRLKQENNSNEILETTLEVDFHNQKINYLNEYLEILRSIVGEYRHIRKSYKRWFIEKNGVDFFIKEITKYNSMMNTLQLSILTWNSEEKIKYFKEKNERDSNYLAQKIAELKINISNLEKEYSENISDSKLIIENILSKELNSIKEEIDNQDLNEFPSKEIDIEEIEEKILILEQEKTKNNEILKNKRKFKEIVENRTKEILSLVGLNDDSLNKFPDQFSGGQKQRIGIARTIITNPRFIIADEPISALDVSVQAQVVNLLKKLHKDLGLTMIFIAHDLEMVYYISTKIAVIYRGNIVEYGDAEKIYKNPKHPYTKSLIEAMPSLEIVKKSLKVSEYSWEQHKYNEFSHPKLHQIEEEHFVFGTDNEIEKWK